MLRAGVALLSRVTRYRQQVDSEYLSSSFAVSFINKIPAGTYEPACIARRMLSMIGAALSPRNVVPSIDERVW